MVNSQHIVIHPKTKSLLDDLKVHVRQPYNEVIIELIKHHILNSDREKIKIEPEELIENGYR